MNLCILHSRPVPEDCGFKGFCFGTKLIILLPGNDTFLNQELVPTGIFLSLFRLSQVFLSDWPLPV